MNETKVSPLNISTNESTSITTLISVSILFFYTIAAPVFEKLHIEYVHESGLSMIIGLLVTLLAKFIYPDVF